MSASRITLPPSPHIILPEQYAGRVFVKQPGRVLYRVLADDRALAAVALGSIRISSHAAAIPLRLYDVREAFCDHLRAALKIERDAATGTLRLSREPAAGVTFPSSTYDSLPPDPDRHAQVPEEYVGSLLMLRSPKMVYRVVPGGFLLAWGCGVYLSRSVLSDRRPLEMADIHRPEETLFFLGASNVSTPPGRHP